MSVSKLLEQYYKVLDKKRDIENELYAYYSSLIDELHSKNVSPKDIMVRLNVLPDCSIKADLIEKITLL